jgi:hypothetical protein
MEDWVARALERWPNVPALYGWLGLDRRGRWLIKGETISRPQIIDTINRNYAADDRGCWFFQNGPQRGFVELEYAPLILRIAPDGESLVTHTELPVTTIRGVYMDETGALLFATEHGPGLLIDGELGWALDRMSVGGWSVSEEKLAEALAAPSGSVTAISIQLSGALLPIERLDMNAASQKLEFVRRPAPVSAPLVGES